MRPNSWPGLGRMHSLAVLVLLQRENVLVEILLQLLVGEVDVELLEAVHLEVLEPKDVEHPNEGELLSSFDASVDPLQDPAEEIGVQRHGHGVSRVLGLWEKYQKRIIYGSLGLMLNRARMSIRFKLHLSLNL